MMIEENDIIDVVLLFICVIVLKVLLVAWKELLSMIFRACVRVVGDEKCVVWFLNLFFEFFKVLNVE